MSVYLYHNAASPMHAEVVDAMLPFITRPVGNPSSLHSYGRMARSAIESAHAQVAELLACDPSSIIFTAGGSEANNLARLEMEQRRHHLQQLRDVFEARLAQIPGSVVFGQQATRLPNTTFFALPYYHGETLLMELDRAGFALASGPACHGAVSEPSHVLQAMGVDDQLALSAIRVSFGIENSLQDVDLLVSKLRQLVDSLPVVVRRVAA